MPDHFDEEIVSRLEYENFQDRYYRMGILLEKYVNQDPEKAVIELAKVKKRNERLQFALSGRPGKIRVLRGEILSLKAQVQALQQENRKFKIKLKQQHKATIKVKKAAEALMEINDASI
ncbi:MAG: hypothetical protein FP816_19675 [Desulfobacteraceae bacterium]|nr:hypothetical protein [Desulfobacteraceae bacterium]